MRFAPDTNSSFLLSFYQENSFQSLTAPIGTILVRFGSQKECGINCSRFPICSLERPLFRATEFFKRRGIIVVISDFYEDPKKAVDMLKPLSYGGNDLIVFQILDPAEIDFPYDEPANFEDLETGQSMPVVPEKLRKQYAQLVQEHIAALSKLCGENRIDYALFNTAMPIDHALFKFLAMREKMSRVR